MCVEGSADFTSDAIRKVKAYAKKTLPTLEEMREAGIPGGVGQALLGGREGVEGDSLCNTPVLLCLNKVTHTERIQDCVPCFAEN